MAIVDPSDSSLTPSVRYRVRDVGGGVPGNWVEKSISDASASGGSITVNTDVVPGDAWLEVQAAFITTKGKYSAWSATETVFSTVNPTAPTAVTVSGVVTGIAGQATVNWTAPNDTLYAGARVYRNTLNNPSSATLVSPSVAGSANGSYSKTISLSPGSYFAWVASINSSGVEGPRVPTGAFSVM